MQSARLPELPSEWRPLRVAMAGNAARLQCFSVPLYALPELLVEADEQAVLRVDPAIAPDPSVPGSYVGRGWRLWLCPDGLERGLTERLVPIDCIGVRRDGSVLDPMDGVSEFESGAIRVPGDAHGIDPCVAIRVLALVGETGLELQSEALSTLKTARDRLFDGSRDLIRYWLTRLLVGRWPGSGLEFSRQAGVLDYLLPEVAALIDFHRSSRHHHKDVWSHTCQVVEQALPRPAVRWAALLHDIGKVHTRSYTPGGKVHFLKHESVGAYMFEGVASRLNFPEALGQRVHDLILHHLRAAMYRPNWSEAAVRRFADQMDEILTDLLDLARADITTKRPATRRRAIYRLHELNRRIVEVRRQDEARRPVIPKGLGTVIIDELGIAPGPEVGALRRRCEQAVRAGSIPENASMDDFIAFLRQELAA